MRTKRIAGERPAWGVQTPMVHVVAVRAGIIASRVIMVGLFSRHTREDILADNWPYLSQVADQHAKAPEVHYVNLFRSNGLNVF